IDLSSGSDTGDSNEDNLINDATATFTITNVDADVTSVEVLNGNISLGFAQQIEGVWTFTASPSDSVGVDLKSLSTAGLNEGENTLTVKVTDAAGNTSTSESLTVTLDTTAPTNKVESLTFSNDTGSSTTDLITNQESQTVTGTLTNALADGESLWIWQNETSGWIDASFAVDGKAVDLGQLFLELGTHTVKAQVRDAAGNLGEVQEWEYTLDTSVSKPSIDLNSTSDTGDSDTDNLTNDTTATFTLTNVDSDASSVQVFNSDVSLGFAEQVDGVWTFTATEGQLLEGENSLTVQVTDRAGNTSVSDSLAVTLDTTVDAESDFAVSVYFIHRVSNAGEAAHVRLTLKGVDEDAVSVVVTFSDSDSNTDDVVVNATKDDAGNWVVADSDIRSLTDGEITVTATLTDVAGNTKEATDTLTMDTIAPETTVGSLALSSFVDTDDGFLTNVTQQTITAILSNKLLDGETLLGSVDGGKTWTDITQFINDDINISWSIDLVNGSSSIQLVVRDAVGNRGAIAEQAYTLDTEKPIIPTFELANDTGISDSDGITNDATINVTLAEDAASWDYSIDGGENWSTGTDSSFELDANATYEIGDIQVRQTDAAGNTSTASSNSTAITVDTTALAAPSFALATDTGTSDSDGITNDTTVTVTLDDDVASWQYSLDGGSTWNTGTDSSFELSADTFYSIGTIQVRQTDTAGNTSTASSNSTAITVDTTALAAPSFALASDTGTSNSDGITNDATVNVTLADDAASWEYSLDGGNTWLTGTGTSFELGANATYAAEQIQVRQTDTAGNTSDIISNDSAITVDTTAPAAASEDAIVWSDDGQSVTLTFSEAINVSKLTIESLTLADGLSFGDGASISASDGDNDGYADTFIITLGTDATVTSDDTITVDKDSAIDTAGNTAGDDIAFSNVRTDIVVFDLTTGQSSDHSDRVFDAEISYTIYIVVDSQEVGALLGEGSAWKGAGNLGKDDEIILVGTNGEVAGYMGGSVTGTRINGGMIEWTNYAEKWQTAVFRVRFSGGGMVTDTIASQDAVRVDLWAGTWKSNPNGDSAAFSERYMTALPTSIGNSQPMS
ncbi:MAG: hypothetical protein KJ883_16945, partial [Gammaproteobacteria bacterium]|nr:hypothetical protein [Gammaproteobacteria bacterium]